MFEKRASFIWSEWRDLNSPKQKLGRVALYFFVLICKAFREMPCCLVLFYGDVKYRLKGKLKGKLLTKVHCAMCSKISARSFKIS